MAKKHKKVTFYQNLDLGSGKTKFLASFEIEGDRVVKTDIQDQDFKRQVEDGHYTSDGEVLTLKDGVKFVDYLIASYIMSTFVSVHIDD